MTSKVFISWSGTLSKKIAEALADWLPTVHQNTEPFFSANDINKGKVWQNTISSELQETSAGIICLTKYNAKSEWIHFEAGALSKFRDKSSVCTLLFDVEESLLDSPLTLFQNTKFTEDEVRKLILDINAEMHEDAKVDEARLVKSFERGWPELRDNIQGILESHSEENKEAEPEPTSEEMVKEILAAVRSIDRRQTGEIAIQLKHLQTMINAYAKDYGMPSDYVAPPPTGVLLGPNSQVLPYRSYSQRPRETTFRKGDPDVEDRPE